MSNPSAAALPVKEVLDQATDLIMWRQDAGGGLKLIAGLGRQADRNGRALSLKLAAHAKLNDRPAFQAVLERMQERPDLRELLRGMCQRLLHQRRLPLTPETFDLIRGDGPTDVRDLVLTRPSSPLPVAQITCLTEVLRAVPLRGPLDIPARIARAALGKARGNRFAFVGQDIEAEDLAPAQRAFATWITDETAKLRILPDLSPLAHLAARGETMVVLRAHAGVNGVISEFLNTVAMPHSLVAIFAADNTYPGDFHVSVDDPDFAFRFTKLCQLMRKGPRLVHIFPDGRKGSSFAATQIAGHRVEVGLGAAALAYYGKSTFFFARTRWTEDGVTADLISGPKVTDSDTKSDVEQKLVRFYAECVTGLLGDDPVDLGLRGGFWQEFLTPRPNAKAPE